MICDHAEHVEDGDCAGFACGPECQGGRAIQREGDEFWTTPCPLPGFDDFVMINDDDPDAVHHVHLRFCRAHLLAMDADLGGHP